MRDRGGESWTLDDLGGGGGRVAVVAVAKLQQLM